MSQTEFILFKMFLCFVGASIIFLIKKLDDEAMKRRGLNVFLAETWIGAILIMVTNGLKKKMPPVVIRWIYYIIGVLIILLGILIQ